MRPLPSVPAPARRLLAGLWLAALCLSLPSSAAAENLFRRGDANGDGKLDVSDGIHTLGFLFSGSAAPPCRDAADANDTGAVDLADAAFIFNFLFQGGVEPPPPGLECGLDPTSDGLGCDAYAPCAAIARELPPSTLFQGGVLEVPGSPIVEFTLALAAGQRVAIDTRNLTAGGDTVLHILDSGGKQLAVNDNIVSDERVIAIRDLGDIAAPLSRASNIVFTAPAAGTYVVVVRARSPDRAGRCDVFVDNQPFRQGVAFGGVLVDMRGLRAGEWIETVRTPFGAGTEHVIYPMLNASMSIAGRRRGNSVAGAARAPGTAGNQVYLVGVVAGPTDGLLRVVRNDAGVAGHDSDGDNLGSELESAVGTCSARSGFARARVPEWKRELLEIRAMERCERVTDTQAAYEDCLDRALAFFDSHQDFTFECSQAADARDTDGDGISDGWEVLGRIHAGFSQALPLWGADPRHKDLFVEVDFMLRQPGETPIRMLAPIARQFASFYQDEVGDYSALRLEYHAATLVNPDRLPGIEVHLDTGRAPERPEDLTLYGDWGGWNAVPPVQKADGSWGGADFNQAWKQHLHPARFGIFRYALPYSTGGGSVPINAFAFAAGIDNAWVLAHESGHAMGLGHSGPAGGVSLDVNCKPNYPSLMNYAFNDGRVGFSDGLSVPSLNNASLAEWQAVPPSNVEYLNVLERKFKYWVDRQAGHVDWNRDGVFAPAGQRVRAYANFMPGNSCEFTRMQAVKVPASASLKAPALARLEGRLYVFYSILGLTRYNVSFSDWNCDNPLGGDCGAWADWDNLFIDSAGGIDAQRIIGFGARPQILIVTIDRDGALWEMRLTIDGQGREVWSDAVPIPGTSPAAGEPSIAAMSACDVTIAYKGTDGRVRTKRLTCAGWEAEELARTAAGQDIAVWEHASPSIARAYLPAKPGVPALYGAFASPQGYIGIWIYDAAARRWGDAGVLESTPGHRVEGRPAMAWVPRSPRAEHPGRFYLHYVNYDGDPTRSFRGKVRNVRMLQSYVKVAETTPGIFQKREVVGLASEFDNVWLYAFGIDLLFDNGIDRHLRAALSIAIDKPDVWATIQFRPKADGLNDHAYINYNDWEVLGVNLCRNVVNPGGLVQSPIGCATATWSSNRGLPGLFDPELLDHRELIAEPPAEPVEPVDPGGVRPPIVRPPIDGGILERG
jgi:hypothetical protein